MQELFPPEFWNPETPSTVAVPYSRFILDFLSHLRRAQMPGKQSPSTRGTQMHRSCHIQSLNSWNQMEPPGTSGPNSPSAPGLVPSLCPGLSPPLSPALLILFSAKPHCTFLETAPQHKKSAAGDRGLLTPLTTEPNALLPSSKRLVPGSPQTRAFSELPLAPLTEEASSGRQTSSTCSHAGSVRYLSAVIQIPKRQEAPGTALTDSSHRLIFHEPNAQP